MSEIPTRALAVASQKGGAVELVAALESVLYEPIAEVEVRALRTIPTERQVELGGPQSLSPSARRLYDLPAPKALDPPPKPYLRLEDAKDDDGSWLDEVD